MKPARLQRDWAEQAAEKLAGQYIGFRPQIARALRRAEKAGYQRGYVKAFVLGMERQKYLMKAAAQSKAAERRGRRSEDERHTHQQET